MAQPSSAVWRYFDRLETADGKFSRCKECGFELRGHGAADAKRHLKLVHDVDDPQTEDSAPGLQPSLTDLLDVQINLLNEKVAETKQGTKRYKSIV